MRVLLAKQNWGNILNEISSCCFQLSVKGFRTLVKYWIAKQSVFFLKISKGIS